MPSHRQPSSPLALLLALCAAAIAFIALPVRAEVASPESLSTRLAVGDLVFIRVGFKPFVEVAASTGSWTNHVGVVVAADGARVEIAESTVPLSRRSSLERFAARSVGGRVAVLRLAAPVSAEQAAAVVRAADSRLGILYDTGFDLHSSGQFCSRFAREVLAEATGQRVGEVETFEQLLHRHPQADLGFWRLWYFGRIPWQRQTVTPASLLMSPALVPVFDGRVEAGCASGGCRSNAGLGHEAMAHAAFTASSPAIRQRAGEGSAPAIQ